MNIFVTDSNPTQAARNLCDKHVSKMLIESAQMLANCFSSDDLVNAPKTKTGNVRRYSYYNHPCSIWVRESLGNFIWLCQHTMEMERERLRRGFNPHFSHEFITWAYRNQWLTIIPKNESITDFPIAINESMNCRKVNGFDKLDRVTQYRLYYKLDKPFATWKQNKPEWFKLTTEEITSL
jgi:hypothetical protein